MENAIEIRQPASLIEMALARGADEKALEKLEKVLELQERWEANEAKKAYHDAMAKFKANPPDIEKDKTVSYDVQGKGTTTYNHSTLANVTNKINRALSEYGLSAAWTTSQETGIKVTCTITHRLGHSESTSLVAASDTSGSKNAIQAIGSTITYLERYTILALTGLATRESDDDGNGSGVVEYITEKQLSELTDMLNNIEGGTEKEYLRLMKFKSMAEIPAKDFERAKQALIVAKKKSVELKAKKEAS